jgi:micrococcal nuclease
VSARLVRVVNGDTIIMRFDGRQERLRYVSTDAPESVTPHQPKEYMGEETAVRNAELPASGPLRLVFDVAGRDLEATPRS